MDKYFSIAKKKNKDKKKKNTEESKDNLDLRTCRNFK